MATGMSYPELERSWHAVRREIAEAQSELRALLRPWWRRLAQWWRALR